MGEVKFNTPDDMTVRSGVAVVVGWDANGNPLLWADFLDDTPVWTRVELLRSALKKAERDMDALWKRPRKPEGGD